MNYTSHIERAERLRELAASIRTKSNDREAIAEGFELVAQAMTPCFDCGAVAHQEEMATEDQQAGGTD